MVSFNPSRWKCRSSLSADVKISADEKSSVVDTGIVGNERPYLNFSAQLFFANLIKHWNKPAAFCDEFEVRKSAARTRGRRFNA